jgi:hypothetical protein
MGIKMRKPPVAVTEQSEQFSQQNFQAALLAQDTASVRKFTFPRFAAPGTGITLR